MTPDPTRRTTSVADLLSVLGSTGLALSSSPRGRDLAVSRTALHDPLSMPADSKAGILLVPGVAPDDPAAAAAVEGAAARGFNAVVVKAHRRPVDSLAGVADGAGIALLVVHDQVDWLHLDSLLHNALGAAATAGGTLPPAPGDLFALAGAIADAVGGATAIEDHSRRVLAYSHSPAHPIDDDRREGILGRKVPELPENDEQYRALARVPGVLRFGAVPPALPRMAVAVRAGQEVVGSIWSSTPGAGWARPRSRPSSVRHPPSRCSCCEPVARRSSPAARAVTWSAGSSTGPPGRCTRPRPSAWSRPARSPCWPSPRHVPPGRSRTWPGPGCSTW